MDAHGPVEPEPVGPGFTEEANRLLLSWVDRHPEVGIVRLVDLWKEHDASRARLALFALHQSDRDWAAKALRDSLGPARAETVLSELAQ